MIDLWNLLVLWRWDRRTALWLLQKGTCFLCRLNSLASTRGTARSHKTPGPSGRINLTMMISRASPEMITHLRQLISQEVARGVSKRRLYVALGKPNAPPSQQRS